MRLSRREFVGATSSVAMLLSGQTRARAEEVAPPPQVPLGKTGITLSRVGQGTGVSGGNRQSNQTRMGFDKLVSLFHHAYDRGITFFDMADLYGTHVYFREALRTIPRDKVTILTKLWWRYDGPDKDLRASYRKQACHTSLQRFCHEINTDHLDIVLLHCLTKGGWDQEMDIYMEALNEAKQKGQVRAVGVSCHDLSAMKTAAACPWVDVLLARINPNGDKMDGSPAEVIEVLRQTKANGKAVIGMKIFGEGALSHRREECIRFAQELGLLDTMTIGFEKPEQVDDVLQLIAKYPARPFA